MKFVKRIINITPKTSSRAIPCPQTQTFTERILIKETSSHLVKRVSKNAYIRQNVEQPLTCLLENWSWNNERIPRQAFYFPIESHLPLLFFDPAQTHPLDLFIRFSPRVSRLVSRKPVRIYEWPNEAGVQLLTVVPEHRWSSATNNNRKSTVTKPDDRGIFWHGVVSCRWWVLRLIVSTMLVISRDLVAGAAR